MALTTQGERFCEVVRLDDDDDDDDDSTDGARGEMNAFVRAGRTVTHARTHVVVARAWRICPVVEVRGFAWHGGRLSLSLSCPQTRPVFQLICHRAIMFRRPLPFFSFQPAPPPLVLQ
jgi:hypothetical protein